MGALQDMVSDIEKVKKEHESQPRKKRPKMVEFPCSGVEIAYRVRAVSRGRYALGSASAEAMYEPGTCAFEPGNGIFEVK